jgi:ribosome maturation factor RimP
VGIEIAGASGAKILRFTADRPAGPGGVPADGPGGVPEGRPGDSVHGVPEGAPGACPGKGSGITLDDCASLSRALSAMLDDLWPGDGPPYVLEVSSPGLDRALLSEAELLRFSGSLARLRLRRGGRTEIVSGRLLCSAGDLKIVPLPPPAKPGGRRREAQPVAFGWDDVTKARLLPEI